MNKEHVWFSTLLAKDRLTIGQLNSPGFMYVRAIVICQHMTSLLRKQFIHFSAGERKRHDNETAISVCSAWQPVPAAGRAIITSWQPSRR